MKLLAEVAAEFPSCKEVAVEPDLMPAIQFVDVTAVADAASHGCDGTVARSNTDDIVSVPIAEELVKVAAETQSCEEVAAKLNPMLALRGTKRKKKKQHTAS